MGILDRAYLIKALYSTCVMAPQCEAPKATTEILTCLDQFTEIRTNNPWVRIVATLYFTTRLIGLDMTLVTK